MFFPADPFLHQLHFILEHGFQPRLGNIAAVFLHAIDGIAKILVIGTHGLGNGTRGPARPKEMARRFLSGPNLGKRAVDIGI